MNRIGHAPLFSAWIPGLSSQAPNLRAPATAVQPSRTCRILDIHQNILLILPKPAPRGAARRLDVCLADLRHDGVLCDLAQRLRGLASDAEEVEDAGAVSLCALSVAHGMLICWKLTEGSAGPSLGRT